MLEDAPGVRVAAFRRGQLDVRPGQSRQQLVRGRMCKLPAACTLFPDKRVRRWWFLIVR